MITVQHKIEPMRKIYLLTFLFFTALIGLKAQTNTNDYLNLEPLKQFKYESNIIYKTVNGEDLDMVLFLPKVKKYTKTPVMLFTHGGGFSSGDKYKILLPSFAETLKILTENGVACATIEYRLVRPGTSTKYDCVVDCKDAGRFLVKNAEKYGLDPKKMGTWGGSAGGNLCLLTALASNDKFLGDPSLKNFDADYKFVVAYFPTTNYLTPAGIAHLGGETAKLLSPITYLKKNSPPILLIHGDADKAVPIQQSYYLLEASQKIGARVEMLTVKGAGHSLKGINIQPSMSEVNSISAQFMMNQLLK
jgi:acetyl esterase/lipase